MPAVGGRRKLGELLVEAGLLAKEQLNAALHEQRKWGGRLGRTVVEMGFVTEAAIAQVLAVQLGLPMVNLDTAAIDPRAPQALRLDLCERYNVFPVAIGSDEALTLATADPTNLQDLQAVEFAWGHRVKPVVATGSTIERAIRRHYFGEATATDEAQPRPAPAAGVSYELDSPERPPPAPVEVPVSFTPTPVPTVEAALRAELATLKERVTELELLNRQDVRATRVLLELLIESGLVSRDEYVGKLNR